MTTRDHLTSVPAGPAIERDAVLDYMLRVSVEVVMARHILNGEHVWRPSDDVIIDVSRYPDQRAQAWLDVAASLEVVPLNLRGQEQLAVTFRGLVGGDGTDGDTVFHLVDVGGLTGWSCTCPTWQFIRKSGRDLFTSRDACQHVAIVSYLMDAPERGEEWPEVIGHVALPVLRGIAASREAVGF